MTEPLNQIISNHIRCCSGVYYYPSCSTRYLTPHRLEESGIDILGEDNRTIIHHKVTAHIVCVFNKQDALDAAYAEPTNNPTNFTADRPIIHLLMTASHLHPTSPDPYSIASPQYATQSSLATASSMILHTASMILHTQSHVPLVCMQVHWCGGGLGLC